MSRTLSRFAVFCAFAACLPAQAPSDPPTTADLLDAVANMAAIFSRTAPGLMAQEILHQRGRRGFIRILEENQNKETKNVTIKLPQDFHVHDVVSDYALGQIGDALAIHEIRSILTIDGRVIAAADEARHALSIGFQSPDDQLKRRLLENFERNRLEGAVTDFGQLILLFASARQNDYDFTPGNERILHAEPMLVLEYKQVSGSIGLTVFREGTTEVRATQGEIWLRRSDLLPLRITMTADTPLARNLTIRDQALVDYTPTPFGLAPVHIHHTQLLNSDVLVENDLQYSDYQRLTPGMLP